MMDDCMKMWYIYTMEYYSAIKKILPFVTTWVGLDSVTPSEKSQMEKDKNHLISLVCEIQNKNRQWNKQRKQTKKNIGRGKRMVTRGAQ